MFALITITHQHGEAPCVAFTVCEQHPKTRMKLESPTFERGGLRRSERKTVSS